MSKKMKIVKWSLISLASLIVLIVAFGYWFISLIPKPVDQEALKASTIDNIAYLSEDIISDRGKILIVVTSTDKMGATEKETGYELTEVSRSYYVFQANGFEVDLASPKGGEAPVIIDDEDMGQFDYAFLNDPVAMEKAYNTIPLGEIYPEEYQAVYFAGGKGAMFDFPNNEKIKTIVSNYYQSNKVIGAVCHGPAALVNAVDQDGRYLFTGKTVCSFTNAEELFLIPDAEAIFPFLLESKLEEQGMKFNEGAMYLKNVIHDGNLITGQNPWSTWTVAETMIKQLGYKPKARTKTGDENAIEVLVKLEQSGYVSAKAKISELCLDKNEQMNRTLLAMHSIVAAMQWKIGKSVSLIALVSTAKSITG